MPQLIRIPHEVDALDASVLDMEGSRGVQFTVPVSEHSRGSVDRGGPVVEYRGALAADAEEEARNVVGTNNRPSCGEDFSAAVAVENRVLREEREQILHLTGGSG